MTLEFILSQTDGRPMYLQIMEQIKLRVASGDWPPGQKLPSIRQLSVASKVSVITVKRAYLELEREGVIITRHGKGSWIADAADLGTNLRQEELEEHLLKAARLAKNLGIDQDGLMQRLREAFSNIRKETP